MPHTECHPQSEALCEYREVLSCFLETLGHHPIAADEMKPHVFANLDTIAANHPENVDLQTLHRRTRQVYAD